MIKSSLDWGAVESDLIHKCSKLTHRGDMKRMIENIRFEVSQLSKAEVEARRGKPYRAQQLLSKINQDIEMIEEYLIVASLLG
jgi:DNA-binding PucR family transcriptional regulator